MRRVLRVATLLLLLPATAGAQRQAETPRPAPIPKTQVSYTTAPVDMTAAKLPANFHGNDPWLIYNGLLEKTPPKGEFETKAAYETRTAAARAALSGVTFATPVAINKRYSSVDYDAEKGVLGVTFYLGGHGFDWGGGTRSVVLANEDFDHGFYTGANAAGAVFQVEAQHAREVRLVFKPKRFPLKTRNVPLLRWNLKIAPEHARQAKDSLAALVFFSAMPDVGYYRDHIGATFRSRTTRWTDQYFLFGQIKAVWFYNRTDGAIYEKWQPKK